MSWFGVKEVEWNGYFLIELSNQDIVYTVTCEQRSALQVIHLR